MPEFGENALSGLIDIVDEGGREQALFLRFITNGGSLVEKSC